MFVIAESVMGAEYFWNYLADCTVIGAKLRKVRELGKLEYVI